MMESKRLCLMQWKQDFCKKGLVFFLERQSEAINDTPKNLQQFGYSIVSLGFIDKLKENVIDGSSDESA